MAYDLETYPFLFRRLPDNSVVGVSASGDHAFLNDEDLRHLIIDPNALNLDQRAELQSKFFLGTGGASGSLRLLTSRIATKQETVLTGPSLHIIVPTLQCDHSCRYCQVSRSLSGSGYTISQQDLQNACDSIFDSPAENLTVEFQGGEPLLRFDLIRFAIGRITERNAIENRRLRFVITTTLHHLDEHKCEFLRKHSVYLSTSIDGPAELHNTNRPLPTRDSYQRTVNGIAMARELVSPDCVSALMTTTRESLAYPEAIVDEYLKLGFGEVFLRSLSGYGFARRNASRMDYSLAQFQAFYEQALEYIFKLNDQGIHFREVAASIVLNKILCPFDAGYVDLQSPTGAGLSTLLYNYDGYVYPSDESRMLAEMGDTSLRLGRIGDSLSNLLNSQVQRDLIRASLGSFTPGCDECAYSSFCGPDPISTKSQWGNIFAPVSMTDHCKRSLWLFDLMFMKLKRGERQFLDLAYRWAYPEQISRVCNA